ncbi:TPA_asm: hypothetical protein [Capsaspora MELD virus 2]|nr:TPA_asm: hypothetical protein [Capsaspora MELD virus 2]
MSWKSRSNIKTAAAQSLAVATQQAVLSDAIANGETNKITYLTGKQNAATADSVLADQKSVDVFREGLRPTTEQLAELNTTAQTQDNIDAGIEQDTDEPLLVFEDQPNFIDLLKQEHIYDEYQDEKNKVEQKYFTQASNWQRNIERGHPVSSNTPYSESYMKMMKGKVEKIQDTYSDAIGKLQERYVEEAVGGEKRINNRGINRGLISRNLRDLSDRQANYEGQDESDEHSSDSDYSGSGAKLPKKAGGGGKLPVSAGGGGKLPTKAGGDVDIPEGKARFGRYFVDVKKLKKGTLSISQANGRKVNGISNIVLSENLKKAFTRKKINSNKVQLTEPETAFYNSICHKCGVDIIGKQKIMSGGCGDIHLTSVRDASDRLKVLLGEIHAGNTGNKELKNEALNLIELCRQNKVFNDATAKEYVENFIH